MGTSFTTLKGLTREDMLKEAGKVIADQINAQAGSNLSTIYPLSEFRDQLGSELVKQFEDGGEGTGALFNRDTVQRVYAKVQSNMKGYRPPVEPADPVRAAHNRARQAEYRRTHRQVWQDK